jgi:hypothetical protein
VTTVLKTAATIMRRMSMFSFTEQIALVVSLGIYLPGLVGPHCNGMHALINCCR